MRARKPCLSDLTDEQWALIEDLIPPAKPGGRPREDSMREVLNAIMYVLRSGRAWRLVPQGFPEWNIEGVAIICGIRLRSGSTTCPTGRILVGPRGS